MEELNTTRSLFERDCHKPPLHHSMPPIISKLMWVNGLRRRIQEPMDKLKKVMPYTLDGDQGWAMRTQYTGALNDFNAYEENIIKDWKEGLETELNDKLNQPLLIAEEYDDEEETRPQIVHVNLEPKLLELLKEVKYMVGEPFNVRLPESAKILLRNSNAFRIQLTATRLETIVTNYNTVMRTITEYEKPLFDRNLSKVDQLFEQGLNEFTWSMKESGDFVESATSAVSYDLFRKLDIVQTNFNKILDIRSSWSEGVLDVFTSRDLALSYTMDELRLNHDELKQKLETLVIPSGRRIHSLVEESFVTVHISEASPAWQDYIEHIDNIVLEGLKKSTLTSLFAMYDTMVAQNQADLSPIPILTIRLELNGNTVAFKPPLTSIWSDESVQEHIQTWIKDFLARGDLVQMASPEKGGYSDYIVQDEKMTTLLANISDLVQMTCDECSKLYDTFAGYSLLWLEDVNGIFQQFLCGTVSIKSLSTKNSLILSHVTPEERIIPSRFSDKKSLSISDNISIAERTFLTPKSSRRGDTAFIPSLDEFDDEINTYMVVRDEIRAMDDYKDYGWLRVNLRPIKHFLTAYASKWMWAMTKYLADQVVFLLNQLEEFLERVEPDIEGVTGDERDTATFMKMMRLFNEVSSQQCELDGQFIAMKKTVQLIKKYDQKLSPSVQLRYDAAPGRWSNLKTKVSLAKQRLGPRIQEETVHITKDLEKFSARVKTICQELKKSVVFTRSCEVYMARSIIKDFDERLAVIEHEAQDLIELQELLETSVVDFSMAPKCRADLSNLKLVWDTKVLIDDQQINWKLQRWQRLNTNVVREAASHQNVTVQTLNESIHTWDVYSGILESIASIQACLPLVDDLSNPAMRTRHWKQLVRVTGGAICVDSDSMKRMQFGELLNMGLQQHVDDVRAIVMRAVKDLAIEKALKTYEEVWLSKIFEMRPHTREQSETSDMADDQTDISASETGSVMAGSILNFRGSRALSRGSNNSGMSKNKRSSVISLPPSLLNCINMEQTGPLPLLHNTDIIFAELEAHQVSLQAMQSSSAAGSFVDEVMKWQRSLQNLESILHLWLQAQEKWIELEQVYSSADMRTALPSDTRAFSQINHDFHLLMRATCEKPNVLQCCSRKNIHAILERMNSILKRCETSLWSYLEKRRQIFPRFYFLSKDDVKHIICNGHDLNKVNQLINKLFENVGSIEFELIDDAEKPVYQIYGVKSSLGEKLLFNQPIKCEGQIETWLSSFLTALKVAIKYHLAVAKGLVQPVTHVPREQRPSSAVSAKGTKKKGFSRMSTIGDMGRFNHPDSYRSSIAPSIPTTGQNTVPHTAPASRSPSAPILLLSPDSLTYSRSWTLDTITEVIWLITRVDFTKHVNNGLVGMDNGDQSSLMATADKIQDAIDSLVGLITGYFESQNANRSAPVSTVPSEFVSFRLPEYMDKRQRQASIVSEQNEGRLSSVATRPMQQSVDLNCIPTLLQQPPQIADDRLLLYPHQTHKLATILTLLAYERDLLQRLLRQDQEQNENMTQSFEWRSQLQYQFDEDSRAISVSCMNATFQYEFEYMGSTTHSVICGQTERAFVNITQAIHSHMSALVVGPPTSNRLETIKELGRCLGQCVYTVNCNQNTDPSLLHDFIRGLASTGCWACLNNINSLQPTVIRIVSQFMNKIIEAQRLKISSVILNSEPIQLSSTGVCFATLDDSVPAVATDPQKMLLVKSAAARLPQSILSQFRVISVIEPDVQMMVEVMLMSHGFNNSKELAGKIMELCDMCKKLIGTSTLIRNEYNLGSDCNSGIHGWSLQTIKCCMHEAGDHFHRIMAQSSESGEGSIDSEEKLKDGDSIYPKNIENIAVVMSLRNSFMPRLHGRDASIFVALVADLWPGVELNMKFSGDCEIRGSDIDSLMKMSNRRLGSFITLKGSLNLNTQVIPMSAITQDLLHQSGKHDVLHQIQDAIAVATSDLGLLPGVTFQARVMQLAQLNMAHQSIFVVGPAGCGKSECIKTFAVAERERGKCISIQSVFTKAIDSQELMGYFNTNTGQWKDGIIASLLRKYCDEPARNRYNFHRIPSMKILQLDGDIDPIQTDILQTLFDASGSVVLGNNERIMVADNIRFIWEMENMSQLSPSIMSKVGLLVMTANDVGWKMIMVSWLERRNEEERELLHSLCNIYLQPTIDYLDRCSQSVIKKPNSSLPTYRRVVYQSKENMIGTMCSIMETIIAPFPDLSDEEYERYFNFACIWAFAGTLAAQYRETFSDFWRSSFDGYIKFPEEGLVFDYALNADTHEFQRWTDTLPMYSGATGKGIPSDAFVSTVHNAQISYLLTLLSDVGNPVMLVGENGCGKTSIVNDRINSVCSGEVAEVLALTIPANKFTSSSLLYKRLDEVLEWKHSSTYVPKTGKRLMCVMDDINFSQSDRQGYQSAIEMVRQHIDDGGFYDCTSHTWRYVKNVMYVATANPTTTANVPNMSQRLLRHFSLFAVSYPENDELRYIFSTLVNSHFLSQETGSAISVNPVGSNSSLLTDASVKTLDRDDDELLRVLLYQLVRVTVDMQSRIRSLFLPTASRCHYIFTMKNLSTIFRNLCLSLNTTSAHDDIMLLWEHECHWMYEMRMTNAVDQRRFRQVFHNAVKKEFQNEAQVQLLLSKPRVHFSNLVEQESGQITAGQLGPNFDLDEDETDLYRPSDWTEISTLMSRGIDEYNKVHPRIQLSLYKETLQQVCRLCRVISSPFEVAHTTLIVEGDAARLNIAIKLAAHFCGFTPYVINPSALSCSRPYTAQDFQNDLVAGYIRSGVKGEKLICMIHEEELLNEDFMVYVMDYVTDGYITSLFPIERQTTIINSIRTEVTQAGLTFTREVAWNYFLNSVRKNFRIVLFLSTKGGDLQRHCLEFPAFTKNLNFVYIQHWNKSRLIDNANYHLTDISWLSKIDRENCAHLLSMMHISIRQNDGMEQTSGQYHHLTNKTFEKFVERFVCLMNRKYEEVETTHKLMTVNLSKLRIENDKAVKLKTQRDHELVVLQERKAGTIQILSLIGQNTAITVQQAKVVKAQMDKITRLKKLLPEYQVAHERAVYKAIAVVTDTKKVVQTMDIDSLLELRSMHQPPTEIEELMAAIIMMVKSPSSDLTWQKGGKRQIANLERFIEELMSFDDQLLPESTLKLVEPYLKKSYFTPDMFVQKTRIAACGSLCTWVRGVVRYHQMMIYKVKRLHEKVEETIHAVDDAQHKMTTLDNKRKALDSRLSSLARGFEEATIDKNEQKKKTVLMSNNLQNAKELRKILNGERQRCQQIYDSYQQRLVAVPGGCAIAAAFVSYIGAYHHDFRRIMLTVHWPNCLRERGIPLCIDAIDVVNGRVIDFNIAGLKTASGASSVYHVDYLQQDTSLQGDTPVMESPGAQLTTAVTPDASQSQMERGLTTPKKGSAIMQSLSEKSGEVSKSEAISKTTSMKSKLSTPKRSASSKSSKTDESKADTITKTDGSKPDTTDTEKVESIKVQDSDTSKGNTDSIKGDTSKEGSDSTGEKETKELDETGNALTALTVDELLEKNSSILADDSEDVISGDNAEEHGDDDDDDHDVDDDNDGGSTTYRSDASIPTLTAKQYNKYVESLVKLLLGEEQLNEWLKQDLSPHQLENATLLLSSWQRPSMLIDPNGDGIKWIMRLNNTLHKRKLVVLNMENRTDPRVAMMLENAITNGKPVLLKNNDCHVDNVLWPLLLHRNTARENEVDEESRMIMFCGRRILCHKDFRLYLATQLSQPGFHPDMASSFSLINFGQSHDTIIENLLMRGFARIRPDLYCERQLALTNMESQKKALTELSDTSRYSQQLQHFISNNATKKLELITDFRNTKVEISNNLEQTNMLLEELDILRDELFPLARRAAVLYSILQSLACLQHEYHVDLSYFFYLFDEAVGGALPGGYVDVVMDKDNIDNDNADVKLHTLESLFQEVANDHDGTKKQDSEEQYEADFEEATNSSLPVASSEVTEDSNILMNEMQKLSVVDDDIAPSIDLPDIIPLPTIGVQYSNLSANHTKQLVDKLTALVYQRIKGAILEEDTLHFATMLCLNIQADSMDAFTEEEMSLLLQGNPGLGLQLTLSDFDCDAAPPTWLPDLKWEDILALSVLPGPLDSICVQIVNHSDSWADWYRSSQTELEPLPGMPDVLSGAMSGVESVDQPEEPSRELINDTPDLGPLTDFHQLLIIRMLRPDRLPLALHHYVTKNLHLNLKASDALTMSDILRDARLHLGVLILYPPSPPHEKFSPYKSLWTNVEPVDFLREYAKENSIRFTCIRIIAGCEALIEESLNAYETSSGWLVIEDMHLAHDDLVLAIRKRLMHINDTKGLSEEPKNRCIWLTTEPSNKLPIFLLQRLYIISASTFNSFTTQNALLPVNDEYFCFDTENVLTRALKFIISSVPYNTMEYIQSLSRINKSAVVGLFLIQAILVSRQIYGCVGLTQWYSLGKEIMAQGLDVLSGTLLADVPGVDSPSAEQMCRALSQVVYHSAMVSESDRRFSDSLVELILTSLTNNPSASIALPDCVITPPPANIEPRGYAAWYEDNIKDEQPMATVILNERVEKNINDMNCSEFISRLDHMFEVINLETNDVTPRDLVPASIHIPKLRSAINICIDQLPPMLDVGDSNTIISHNYDFSYHHPSNQSVASVSSNLMPESIGYVLLEECNWLNNILHHIRQHLSEMQLYIIGGPHRFKAHLVPIGCVLQEEQVPLSWCHPYHLPTSHSLTSWLNDLKHSYNQLYKCLKKGMVPTRSSPDPAIACGNLQSLWLGGFVNPQALFGALKQEKAYLEKCSTTEIRFECVVLADDEEIQEEHKGGFLATDLHLEGASWNYSSNSLAHDKKEATIIRRAYIYPTFGPVQRNNEHEFVYDCPVYVNQSRQRLVLSVPLNSDQSPDKWVLSSTAIFLVKETPEDAYKKSRSYLMVQKMLASGEQEEESPLSSARSVLSNDEGSQVEQSEISQMSYKPMSPNAAPLPADLSMVRESQISFVGIDRPHASQNHIDVRQSTEFIDLRKPKGSSPTPRERRTPEPRPVSTSPDVKVVKLPAKVPSSRPTSVEMARRRLANEKPQRKSVDSASQLRKISIGNVSMNRYQDDKFDDDDDDDVQFDGLGNLDARSSSNASSESHGSIPRSDIGSPRSDQSTKDKKEQPEWLKSMDDTNENAIAKSPASEKSMKEATQMAENIEPISRVSSGGSQGKKSIEGGKKIALPDWYSSFDNEKRKSVDSLTGEKRSIDRYSLTQKGLHSRDITPPLIHKGEVMDPDYYASIIKPVNKLRVDSDDHFSEPEKPQAVRSKQSTPESLYTKPKRPSLTSEHSPVPPSTDILERDRASTQNIMDNHPENQETQKTSPKPGSKRSSINSSPEREDVPTDVKRTTPEKGTSVRYSPLPPPYPRQERSPSSHSIDAIQKNTASAIHQSPTQSKASRSPSIKSPSPSHSPFKLSSSFPKDASPKSSYKIPKTPSPSQSVKDARQSPSQIRSIVSPAASNEEIAAPQLKAASPASSHASVRSHKDSIASPTASHEDIAASQHKSASPALSHMSVRSYKDSTASHEDKAPSQPKAASPALSHASVLSHKDAITSQKDKASPLPKAASPPLPNESEMSHKLAAPSSPPTQQDTSVAQAEELSSGVAEKKVVSPEPDWFDSVEDDFHHSPKQERKASQDSEKRRKERPQSLKSDKESIKSQHSDGESIKSEHSDKVSIRSGSSEESDKESIKSKHSDKGSMKSYHSESVKSAKELIDSRHSDEDFGKNADDSDEDVKSTSSSAIHRQEMLD